MELKLRQEFDQPGAAEQYLHTVAGYKKTSAKSKRGKNKVSLFVYPARALREIYGVHVAVAKIGNATVNTCRVYYRVRDRVRNSGISSIATAKKLMNFEEFHSSSASLCLWLRRNHQICSRQHIRIIFTQHRTMLCEIFRWN